MNVKIEKIICYISVLVFSVSILFSGCSSDKLNEKNQPGSTVPTSPQVSAGTPSVQQGTPVESTRSPGIDVEGIKPNEAGKIMVVMFHKFVDKYEKGDKNYTTTFDDFQNLLKTLYDSGYRLINLNDYLNNKINVPAGLIPIVFTFDDGTAEQFNLEHENGTLVANKKSAVGIMEEFNKIHPEFGLKGTFYVNLGDNTFFGKGTVAERLRYLIDKGFEIGNHTFTHINLKNAKSAEEIQKEIGGNQKKMYELVPGYTFTAFSLPYGRPSKDLQQYVVKGEFEGITYENKGIMEVGWDPALSPVSLKFNPFSIHRVRASGIVAVEADLAWWLEKLSRAEQYVSDGNTDTITVPKSEELSIDMTKLNEKKLIVY